MKKRIFITLLFSAVCAFGAIFSAGCNTPTGKFYTLQEAYDNGFLTQEDLMSIAYYHNGTIFNGSTGRYGNEEIMPEDYVPKSKMPEELSMETRNAICKTYFDKYYGPNNLDNVRLNDIGIGKDYYGTYNKCVVVKVWVDNYPVTDDVNEYIIGGVKICYTNGKRISVWVKD